MRGVDENRFDLRAGELLAGAGKDDRVVIGGMATMTLDDDVSNLSAFQCIGQIHPSNLHTDWAMMISSLV